MAAESVAPSPQPRQGQVPPALVAFADEVGLDPRRGHWSTCACGTAHLLVFDHEIARGRCDIVTYCALCRESAALGMATHGPTRT